MFPVFIDPSGSHHTCIAWACGIPKLNWEWYGFEKNGDDIYYGYVMGFENEWGSFSATELADNEIQLVTDEKSLNEIEPPLGWTKENK